MSSASPGIVLAFDYGERRIGIAIGERRSGSTRAAGVVSARGGLPDWAAIGRRIRDWEPELLVVGIPSNMDGTPSAMTERTREFARELERRFALPVAEVDERLTSWAAVERLRSERRSGQRRRRISRQDIDQAAAELILATWMQNPSGRGGTA